MSEIPSYSPPYYADYETPQPAPGLFSRMLPSPMFYWRIASEVLRSAGKAKWGTYEDADWYQSSFNIRLAIEKTGGKLSIRGTGNLAKVDGPCVIIGNHMSTAETFLLASIIRPFMPVTFVVKQSLVEYPIFKHVMRSRDPIVVGRTNPREDLKAVLEGGKQRLASGISIIIFPQRTRTVQFDRESFNTIGVKLAKRAGVPVVPVALKTDAWSNGTLLKDYGTFYPERTFQFEFGEPLYIDGSDHPVHEAVSDFIEERLTTWGLPPASKS